ncbi:MAG: hypothetical protein ABL973_04130 [Micropepsaceae bacterium]
MFATIMRVILGILGALALFVAVNAFLNPDSVATQLGLSLMGNLGISTFRGDIGGLFAGSGLFMFAAAIRGNRLYLAPPLLYLGIALAARTATAMQVGFLPELIPPMTVEAVATVILTLGYTSIGRSE